MVVPRAFEDVEGAVDLFGEYQSGEVVGENEFAEFDAGVLLSQGVGKSVGTADGEYDFAAGLGECFFYEGCKPAAVEGFSPFVAENEGVARLHDFEQGFAFLDFLGFRVGCPGGRQELQLHAVHGSAAFHIIVTQRIDFGIFVIFDGGDQDHEREQSIVQDFKDFVELGGEYNFGSAVFGTSFWGVVSGHRLCIASAHGLDAFGAHACV